MAIKSETRLGPYEIVSALGAGGMGEVYRARAPRLNRDVASYRASSCPTDYPGQVDAGLTSLYLMIAAMRVRRWRRSY